MGPVKALLLTQCVQEDFVRPLSPGEPLPNLVHVGRLEAERLCGPTGALVRFLEQAHGTDPDDLAIVHVADEHDARRDARHFALFRPHCLAGTAGARLVGDIEVSSRSRPRTRRVAAGDLNDFEDSPLPEVLAELPDLHPGTPVAVIGVWTDVKVSYLLYDLHTRLGLRNLATCSALTASRSAGAHFRALDGLQANLGVHVHHSPATLLRFLVPASAPRPTRSRGVRIVLDPPVPRPAAWSAGQEAERDALLDDFAAGAPELRLSSLGGGFSGAQVFLARRMGAGGEASAPRVMKIGARDEIARERFGNERVARILGGLVPRLLAYGEGPSLGAMELELVERPDPAAGAPTTFKRAYEQEASDEATELLAAVLDDVLGRGLARLYHTAEKDNADLFEVYGFTDGSGAVPFGASIVGKAEAVARTAGFEDATALLEAAALGEPWLSPHEFYGEWLPGRTRVREVYPCLVHGDLNLANVLLSRAPGGGLGRVWVIDFARLARLPLLTDCAKIENDLAYILFRPEPDAAGRARGEALHAARVGSAGLEVDLLPLAETAAERRFARLIGGLRRVAAGLDGRGAPAMDDYRFALMRYAAHTLGFDECDAVQRRFALLDCARLAGRIAAPA